MDLPQIFMPQYAVELAAFEAAFLKTGVHFRRGKGHCAPAFPIARLRRREWFWIPLRRLDVRSKAREIGIIFRVLRHYVLLFWFWAGSVRGLRVGWQGKALHAQNKMFLFCSSCNCAFSYYQCSWRNRWSMSQQRI